MRHIWTTIGNWWVKVHAQSIFGECIPRYCIKRLKNNSLKIKLPLLGHQENGVNLVWPHHCHTGWVSASLEVPWGNLLVATGDGEFSSILWIPRVDFVFQSFLGLERQQAFVFLSSDYGPTPKPSGKVNSHRECVSWPISGLTDGVKIIFLQLSQSIGLEER